MLIEVTQEIIDEGVVWDYEKNAICLAVGRVLLAHLAPAMFFESIYIRNTADLGDDFNAGPFMLPYEALTWDESTPFSFELDIPAEYLRPGATS